MKRELLSSGIILLGIVVAGFIFLYILIDSDVKRNISTAQERYTGTAEDALLSYLADSTNSFRSRSEIAIWTLGQIKSRKALPVLEHLYKNDPDGKSCVGNHESMLCQRAIYKALQEIKSRWWPLHERLNR
jgi:hypothetical protein